MRRIASTRARSRLLNCRKHSAGYSFFKRSKKALRGMERFCPRSQCSAMTRQLFAHSYQHYRPALVVSALTPRSFACGLFCICTFFKKIRAPYIFFHSATAFRVRQLLRFPQPAFPSSLHSPLIPFSPKGGAAGRQDHSRKRKSTPIGGDAARPPSLKYLQYIRKNEEGKKWRKKPHSH